MCKYYPSNSTITSHEKQVTAHYFISQIIAALVKKGKKCSQRFLLFSYFLLFQLTFFALNLHSCFCFFNLNYKYYNVLSKMNN